MFVLDSFLHWVLTTVATAAEAEMHDDTALREQLLEAEMRRELGEISETEFAAVEADLLARIRAIAERRRGGADGPSSAAIAIARAPDEQFEVDAFVLGDFHADGSDAAAPRPLRPPRRARRPGGPARPGPAQPRTRPVPGASRRVRPRRRTSRP